MTDAFEVHPLALCESQSIGPGSSVGAFAYVHALAVIGEGCGIGNAASVESGVTIGDAVTVGSGARLLEGVRVGDDAVIGPNATLGDRPVSTSATGAPAPGVVIIEAGAMVGANATVVAGVTVGRKAVVGAGSVVTRDVPANARVVGSPARIIGYADESRPESEAPSGADAVPRDDDRSATLPGGASVVVAPVHTDLRGSLSVWQFADSFPFVPRRCFVVFDVPSQYVRGEHAHRECWQYLTCVSGAITVHLDDGKAGATVVLDGPELGLAIPPMVWASQFNATTDAVLVVFASHDYDAADYVRRYEDFLELVNT